MPPTLTYPGVYIVEVPSGVQTITGVATSIAAFFGQASQGPVNTPIECQTPSDFTRNFGAPISGGYLGQMVQQFFANGGSDCYVVRIAGSNGGTAAPSTKTLSNAAAAPVPVLTLNASSQGVWSNNLLVVVDYDTPTPDATFNLTVIYLNQGVVAQTESFTSLSMDPNSPRFAPTFLNQSSNLLSVPAAQPTPTPASGNAYSQIRYPFAVATNDLAAGALLTLINTAFASGTATFTISVDGGPATAVSVSTAVAANFATFAALKAYLEGQINQALGPASGFKVQVSADAAPGGSPIFLRVTSIGAPGTSVAITRGPSNDLASILMAGVDQGGIEVPKYSDLRPAPNGIAFTGDTATVMTDLAAATLSQVTQITVAGTNIPIVWQAAGTTPFYQGSGGASDFDGIRENLQTIADAVNSAGTGWQATLAGYRLMIDEIRPNSPQDVDSTFKLTTTAASNAAPLGAGFSNLPAQTNLDGGSDGGTIQPSYY